MTPKSALESGDQVSESEESASADDVDKSSRTRIVYLLGAGATHGSVRSQGGSVSLVMPGLTDALYERMREQFLAQFADDIGMERLVNEVVDTNTDFEQLITFLQDAPSDGYRRFAEEMKRVFSAVLRAQLEQAQAETAPNHSRLYAVLLDMHDVVGNHESLAGLLTLNYDGFLEHAITEHLGKNVDYGIDVRGQPGASSPEESVTVLKLHGSFGWKNAWPIEVASPNDPELWIPPGIRKSKTDYPFNAIWGAARELLDCDVLRIVGCNLGANDWDLISLLFTTMHARGEAETYTVEVIGWPTDGLRMAEDFPYLKVQSLLELPDVGPMLVSELLGSEPAEFASLDNDSKRTVLAKSADIGNPFEHWLRLKAELMFQELPSLDTATGILTDFMVS